MKRLQHIMKQSAATVMLLLFAAYYVQVNFFVHSHIVNGVTVVHSHVHRSAHHDTANGGHTIAELTLIAQLHSQLLTVGAATQDAPEIFLQILLTIGTEQQTVLLTNPLLSADWRAPPMV